VAVVQERKGADFKHEFLVGGASLTVNNAADGGTLALNFPKYYNVVYNLSISGAEIGNAGGIPTITDLGGAEKTGIDLRPEATRLWSGDSSVGGKFYGDGSASEAVGTFETAGYIKGPGVDDSNHGHAGERSLEGAFGVKTQ
jgi:hypothetical protein